MIWYEIRLRRGKHPLSFLEFLPFDEIRTFHYFWDEPWWPKAYVLRIAVADDASLDLNAYPGSDHIVIWDASEDEEAYGEIWPEVSDFFRACSSLPHVDREEDFVLKMVHCFLNSRGFSERDEAKFAARLLWNRVTIKLRWRLYLKRRWERAQRAESVSST